MKTDKSIFDIGLYKEGLRSVQMVGLIFTALLTIVSIFCTVENIVSAVNNYENNAVQLVSLIRVNPLIVITFCLATPIMALVAFNFTTKRSASDFYFSVPKTRTTVYWSFSAAVMSWTVLMIAVSSAVPLLIFPFFKKYVLFNFASAFFFIAAILICCVLVMGAVNLAVALTGNFVSNVLVALMIIFLPRILLVTVTQGALEDIPIINFDTAAGFLSPYMNLVFGAVYSFFSLFFFGDNIDFSSVSFFYTLGLGILYLILGNIALNRRKSEAATYAASTPLLRHVYRIALASSVMLIATVITYSYGVNTPVILIITLILLSLLTYCVYELIATKSIRSTVRVLPGFLIVVAVNVALLASMFIISSSVLKYQPNAENIDGFYISDYDLVNSFSARDDLANNELYWSKRTKDVLITDKEAKEIVTGALKENIKYYKSNDRQEPDNYFDDTDIAKKYLVSFCSGPIKHTRVIYLDDQQNQTLAKCLSGIGEYKNIFTDLPQPNEPNISVKVYGDYALKVSQSDAKAIYSAFLQDIEKFSFQKLLAQYNNDSDFETYIQIKTFYKGHAYNLEFPITSDMKNATQKLIKLNGNGRDKQIEIFKQFKTSDNLLYSIEFYNSPDIFDVCQTDDRVLDVLLSGDLSAPTGDQPFAALQFNYDHVDDGSGLYANRLFFSLSDSQMKEIEKIAKKTIENSNG